MTGLAGGSWAGCSTCQLNSWNRWIGHSYAWIRIRQGNKGEHRKWMIRNFALTLAAVSLRIQLPLLTGAMGFSFEPSYQFIAWMCWVPNLIIAEWWILNKR